MKLWSSIAFSITAFMAVIVLSLTTLVKINILKSDAAAIPVYSSTPDKRVIFNENSYNDAKTNLKLLGIELSTGSDVKYGQMTYTSPMGDDNDLLKGAKVLQEEFLKYSKNTISLSGLKKIYLVKNLSVNGQYRSGKPDPMLEDALYFDVSNKYLSSEDGSYMRRTYHHEFKHLIDYNLYNNYQGDSDNWDKCNTANFRYGNGGSSMYNNADFAHSVHPVTGFINGYSTSGIEEDRAEVYAEIMTNPENLQSLANNDANILCKVSQTQNLQKLL